jgi:hypothetical protein
MGMLLLAIGAAVSTRFVLQQRANAVRRPTESAFAAAADAERARQRQELLDLARRIDRALDKGGWQEAIALLREVSRLVEKYHYEASAEDNLPGTGWQCVIDPAGARDYDR